MKSIPSMTRLEEQTAEDMLFLLSDEIRAQRRQSGAPRTLKARMRQIRRDATRLEAAVTGSERRCVLALLACHALETLLFLGDPGKSITEVLKSGTLKRK